MKLFQRFDLPKSGVVHFLLVCGRRNAIEPILMSRDLRTASDVLEGIRGAVAAEGPNGGTALTLARSALHGTHPSLKPIRQSPGARFVWGPTATFNDGRVWIAPENHKGGAESEWYYGAASEAAATLHNAGFTDEVVTKIAADDVSIDLYSTCITHKKNSNTLTYRCACQSSLPAHKRAFAICVLIKTDALGELTPNEIIPVLAAAEQDAAHTRWVAPMKSAYCEKLERFEEMQTSCDLLTRTERDNAAAWLTLAGRLTS